MNHYFKDNFKLSFFNFILFELIYYGKQKTKICLRNDGSHLNFIAYFLMTVRYIWGDWKRAHAEALRRGERRERGGRIFLPTTDFRGLNGFSRNPQPSTLKMCEGSPLDLFLQKYK